MRRAMMIVGSLLLLIGLTAPSAAAARDHPGSARSGKRLGTRLAVRVVASAGRSWPGGLVTYTIVVRNRSHRAVSGATLGARMARGLSVVRISPVVPLSPVVRTSSAVRTSPVVRSDPMCGEVMAGRVGCTLPELEPGEGARVAITAVVGPGVVGRLRTRVEAGAARAVVVTLVRAGTDLAVRLRIVRRVRRAEVIAATVLNRGPRTARHVVLLAGTDGGRILGRWGARCTIGGRARCGLGRMRSGSWRTVWFKVSRGATLAAVVEPEHGDLRPADNTALES
jgi:hypothetical protein